jgi:ribosomal protein S18 acetylase RimI-like enzyme
MREQIRPAIAGEARAIAEIHVESSKAIYRGILPEAVLNELSVEKRETFWKGALSSPEADSVTLVGCGADGRIVGFLSGGRERTGQLGCDAELYAIYLLPGAQRRGLGTMLVREFAREMGARGFSSLVVWVFALSPCRKFYEAFGGRVIAEERIERGGQPLTKVAYGWSDLRELRPS